MNVVSLKTWCGISKDKVVSTFDLTLSRDIRMSHLKRHVFICRFTCERRISEDMCYLLKESLVFHVLSLETKD